MYTISDAKRIAKQHGFIVVDTSGAGSYGYDYALFKAESVTEPIHYIRRTGDALVTSVTVHQPNVRNKGGTMGAFRPMFDRAAFDQAIANA